jgi:SUMO ligase MMS21 Smc5/6 complex component
MKKIINNNEVASNTILIKEMVISNTCDLQKNKDFRIDPLLEII